MNKLVASAEDMVLRDDALQAGFDLSILLKISLGLSSERAMIAYLVAHPESVQFAIKLLNRCEAIYESLIEAEHWLAYDFC